MGITKTALYSDEQNDFAAMAKVLGHPARVAILEHLIRTKACINSDLVQELGLAQATISQHLKELKAIGLLQGTIEGTSMNYCINPKKWQAFKENFNSLFDSYSACSSDQCC
jgi:predicted transcriptional regulator